MWNNFANESRVVIKFLHEVHIMASNVERKFHHYTTLISKVILHVPILCPDDIKHFTLSVLFLAIKDDCFYMKSQSFMSRLLPTAVPCYPEVMNRLLFWNYFGYFIVLYVLYIIEYNNRCKQEPLTRVSESNNAVVRQSFTSNSELRWHIRRYARET